MKRTERHHLKENELVHTIESARELLEGRQKQIVGAVIALVVVGLAFVGYKVFRQQTESRGQDLLAQAMVALNARVVPAGEKTEAGDAPAAATLGATGTFATEEAKLNAALPKL